MSLSQTSLIVPPVVGDNGLKNFSQVIQSSFYTLYQAAHIHRVITTDPKPNDGIVGDVYLIDGTSKYIAIKFSSGWFKFGPLVAI